MFCLLGLLDKFSVVKPMIYEGIPGKKKGNKIDPQYISRQTSISDMIKSILPSNLPFQDLFRT